MGYTKHFRFSLRTLLILPVFIALGFAWVTWPARTLESFRNAIEAGDFELASSMVECVGVDLEIKATSDYPTGGIFLLAPRKFGNTAQSSYFFENLYALDRNLADIVLARSLFFWPPSHSHDAGLQFEIVIERGGITVLYNNDVDEKTVGLFNPPPTKRRR